MENKEPRLRILMFPWLAHGHIAPLFEVAKKLAERNFYIYLCSTPINLVSIRQQIGETPLPNLELIDHHLPSTPELPPHLHSTKSLPKHLMNNLRDACDLSRPDFTNLLIRLKPDLLIYDLMQSWTHAVASSYNIPAIAFGPCAASATSYLMHMGGKPGVPYPYPAIYLHQHELNKIIEMFSSDHRNTELLHPSLNLVLIRSFREIEGKYIDYLSEILGKEILPLGPMVREAAGDDKESRSEVMEWLDKKDNSSVVFVSFGSEYFMTREEIEDFAYELEHSKVNFVWFIRFLAEDNTTLNELLPEGFLKRVGDRGLVLEGWAPQVQILKHCSIGGFVCHCGWGTVIETLKYGVPIIGIPMHIDNFIDSRLVVELGVGIEVKRSKFGGGGIARGDLAKVIDLVVIEKEGEEVRRKAKEMSKLIVNKGEEEIDVLVEKLLKICGKTQN